MTLPVGRGAPVQHRRGPKAPQDGQEAHHRVSHTRGSPRTSLTRWTLKPRQLKFREGRHVCTHSRTQTLHTHVHLHTRTCPRTHAETRVHTWPAAPCFLREASRAGLGQADFPGDEP